MLRLLILFMLIPSVVLGALTVNKVPRVRTGGTTPSLQDGVMVDDGTNVGIGTATPQATLDVNSTGNSTFGANVGIGTISPVATLEVTGSGNNYLATNVGIGTLTPSTGLELGPGVGFRAVGIGTTVPQPLCRKTDGTMGYYNGTWAGTCS